MMRQLATIICACALPLLAAADAVSPCDGCAMVRVADNGRVLFNECLNVNPKSYLIESCQDIDFKVLEGAESVGICGATSTPKWLMEECREFILTHFND